MNFGGAPLDKNCSADRMVPPTVEQDRGGGYRLLEDKWFYLSLGLGFFFNFWSVLVSLLADCLTPPTTQFGQRAPLRWNVDLSLFKKTKAGDFAFR
ncbi:hypothetical protein COP1_001675 [Malus domestica]